MTSTLQLSIRWKDEFLKWNESIYPYTISFRPMEIWVPDLITNNNVNNFKFESQESYLVGHSNNIFDLNERNKYFVMVNPNGECRWVFPMKLMSVCQLNQDYFPFDIQECYIDFRSSAYFSDQLRMTKFENGVHLKLINEAEFDLIKADAQNFEFIIESPSVLSPNETSISKSFVRVNILLKRKMVFYMNKIILPYFVFYIVTIFTYVIPVDSGEKKSYSTSILISAMIYLKDSCSYITKTTFLPILSVYFNLNLVFIFLCIIFTTFIYAIYYLDKLKKPLPNFLKKFITKSDLSREDMALKDILLKESIKQNLEKQINSNDLSVEQQNIYKEIKISIQDELYSVNNELSKLKKSFLNNNKFKTNDYFKKNILNYKVGSKHADRGMFLSNGNIPTYSVKHDSRKKDLLGSEMLGLLKTLKKFIVKHSDTSNEANDLDNVFKFCTGLNVIHDRNTDDICNQETIYYDKKIVKNFHFINTLENLKFDLVKTKSKSKSLSKINKLNENYNEYNGISNNFQYRSMSHFFKNSENNLNYNSYSSSNANSNININKSSWSTLNSANLDLGSKRNNNETYKSCYNKNEKYNQKQIDKQLCLKNSKQYLGLLIEYKHQIKKYLQQFDVDEEVDLRHNSTKKSTLEKKEIHTFNKIPSYTFEWKYLAIIIDRIVFYFFTFLIPICILVMYLKAILLS